MYEEIMTPAASDGEAAERFIKLVEYLRAPDGCPWDREQTHKSLIRPMVEETYEAIEAIEKQDMKNLREELGDMLMQVVMQAQIAKEEGLFPVRSCPEAKQRPAVIATLYQKLEEQDNSLEKVMSAVQSS